MGEGGKGRGGEDQQKVGEECQSGRRMDLTSDLLMCVHVAEDS